MEGSGGRRLQEGKGKGGKGIVVESKKILKQTLHGSVYPRIKFAQKFETLDIAQEIDGEMDTETDLR